MAKHDVMWSKRGLPALSFAVLLTVLSAFAAYALGLHRLALWQVVRACVADLELTGSPFPCRQIDHAGADAPLALVLQPPVLNDMIVVPTRKVVGVEDDFLQSPESPNYFAAAWRARSQLVKRGGRKADWDDVGLVVNPAMVRSQDQMHIHVGCLLPKVQSALALMAPEVVPHIAFWGTRVARSSLEGVEPFRLAAEALSGQVTERGKITVMVAGVRVAGADQFLILASYAGAPHSWWPIGADSLVDTSCSA
jgi:CDP-diacylglycerol pyrophosphatase